MQTLLSLQLGGVPAWHLPLTHASLPSQAFWLSQSASVPHDWQFGTAGFWQPSAVSQESVVQALPSLQLTPAPL